MKAIRWSTPQRPVKNAAGAETQVVEDIENENTPDENSQGDKVSKPARAKTTRTKKQEK